MVQYTFNQNNAGMLMPEVSSKCENAESLDKDDCDNLRRRQARTHLIPTDKVRDSLLNQLNDILGKRIDYRLENESS